MLNRLFESQSRSNRSKLGRRPQKPQLRFEPLESRRLLAVFVVNNVSDVGSTPGSLRDAITEANENPGPDQIVFSDLVFLDQHRTIRLRDELIITDTLQIDGPGQEFLTLDVQHLDPQETSRVLHYTGVSGDLTLSGLTITGGETDEDNSSPNDTTHSGGGIRFLSSGNLTLIHSTVTDNHTLGLVASGGGIFTETGSVHLVNSKVSGNSTFGVPDFGGAPSYAIPGGGGIGTISGSVTLTNSTVSDNQTAFHNTDGGGIYTFSGAVTLTNSTVSGNQTSGDVADGGGIATGIGQITLTNSTVANNRTSGVAAYGGGIFSETGSVIIKNSTISGNQVLGNFSRGGGIYTYGSSFRIENSIIAGNSDNGGAPDLSPRIGDFTGSLSSSLIGDTTGTGFTDSTGIGNQLNVNPRLSPLTFLGGPTQTFALLSGSPAIDAGDNLLAVDETGLALPGDQRDFRRFVSSSNGQTNDGSIVDIGAFEYRANAFDGVFSTVTITTTGDGTGSGGGVGELSRPDQLATFTVEFDKNVLVSAADLTVCFLTLPGIEIDLSDWEFNYDESTFTATWTVGETPLLPGFYSFKLSPSIVSEETNVSLDGDSDGFPGGVFSTEVYVALPGDANLDGTVDVLGDAAILVNNLGTTSGATWADADFNGDEAVDVLTDAAILVDNLGQSVLPPNFVSAFVSTSAASSLKPSIEPDRPRYRSPMSELTLSLAGSQDLDSAFESINLIDEGLF